MVYSKSVIRVLEIKDKAIYHWYSTYKGGNKMDLTTAIITALITICMTIVALAWIGTYRK